MDTLLQQAKDLYAAGKLEDAIRTCNRVLKTNPDDPAALFCRGMCYESKGETEVASADYGAAFAAQPAFREAALHRAGCYVGMFDFASALQAYDELARKYPDWGRVFRDRASVHCNCGNDAEECDDLIRAIELGEDDAEMHFRLFNSLDSLERTEEGLVHLDRAIELAPENEEYRAWRSASHPDDAIRYADNDWLFARNPNNSCYEEIWLSERLSSMETSRINEVILEFEKKYSQASTILYYSAALACFERHQYDEAGRWMVAHLAGHENEKLHASDYAFTAKAFFLAEEIDKAVEVLTRFCSPGSSAEDRAYCHSWLARCRIRQGRTNEAQQLLDEVDRCLEHLDANVIEAIAPVIAAAKEELRQAVPNNAEDT